MLRVAGEGLIFTWIGECLDGDTRHRMVSGTVVLRNTAEHHCLHSLMIVGKQRHTAAT
jgi:hypothetical protein